MPPTKLTPRPGVFARYPSLRDRVVFVTGGGSGIGAALVEAFAEQGARVAFVDIDAKSSEALVAKVSETATRPLFIACDLTDIAALRAAVDTVRARLGPISILVNNAANDQRQPAADVTPDSWDAAQAVNLRHQFFAAQAVHPHMKVLGAGSIINFSSIAWMGGGPDFVPYATAKAGVIGLTNSLAKLYGPDNIRVNAIAPGAVHTERQLRLWYDEARAEQMAQNQPLKHWLLADELARAALFLASDDSRMITKQCLIVDAGIR
jgi:NAD(P)-dependent dehydrogenase (short-subunit alcohol dehydrogenase family)